MKRVFFVPERPGAPETPAEMPMGPTPSEASEGAQGGLQRRSWRQGMIGG